MTDFAEKLNQLEQTRIGIDTVVNADDFVPGAMYRATAAGSGAWREVKAALKELGENELRIADTKIRKTLLRSGPGSSSKVE